MKAKTQFLKMFSIVPEQARKDLIFMPYEEQPMTLNVIALEVKNNTKLSKKLLKKMGYT